MRDGSLEMSDGLRKLPLLAECKAEQRVSVGELLVETQGFFQSRARSREIALAERILRLLVQIVAGARGSILAAFRDSRACCFSALPSA